MEWRIKRLGEIFLREDVGGGSARDRMAGAEQQDMLGAS